MSKNKIINQALGELGLDGFATFEENTKPEDHLDSSVEDVILEFDWNSTTKISKLAKLNEQGIMGYQYAYNLPNNLIRLIDCYDSLMIDGASSNIAYYNNIYTINNIISDNRLYSCYEQYRSYSIIGVELYSNVPNITCRYSALDLDNIAILPRYIQSLIAIRFAYLLSNFYDVDRKSIDNRYNVELARAKALDSSHSSPISSFLSYTDYAKLIKR